MGLIVVAIVLLSLAPRWALPALAQETGLAQTAKPIDLLSIRQPDTDTDKPNYPPTETQMANDHISLDKTFDPSMGEARDRQIGESTSSRRPDIADANTVKDDTVASDNVA